MTISGSDTGSIASIASSQKREDAMLELCERIDVIARRWNASALGVYEHVQIEDGEDNRLVYGWDEEDDAASLVLDPSTSFALDVQWRRLLGHAEVIFDGPSVVRLGDNVALRYVAHPSMSTATYVVVSLHSDAETASKCSRELDAAMTTTQFSIDPKPVSLTKRELEIARWICEGKTSSEIAVILSLSEHTVNDYIRSGMKKMGATNRLSFIAKTIRRGLVA
ncbi:LuxR family transcriptional regulator (plasmid) [Rhizobium rosettiformans]|uniref:LuxR family transcriptional regulator n=1 Tax=Rhizobium rosettiformans TaxID=1368430 RepID=A0ABX7F5P2_9HYPH|nr:helix-turn-helix transcriptional regulator [Rhizobium rosettiformans]QRF54651.1 LuxR family transcriptional regulator [Rhizobium rosettiformans]